MLDYTELAHTGDSLTGHSVSIAGLDWERGDVWHVSINGGLR